MAKSVNSNIHQIVHLSHELHDITSKLRCLCALLNRGEVDPELFEATSKQIGKCHLLLSSF